MVRTNVRLMAAVEACFADLRWVRASGRAAGEWSSYGLLAGLLNVSPTPKPKEFCVQELADQGPGHTDFGLYTARQVQWGQPREGQTPEGSTIEVKVVNDDTWVTVASDQVSCYWDHSLLELDFLDMVRRKCPSHVKNDSDKSMSKNPILPVRNARDSGDTGSSRDRKWMDSVCAGGKHPLSVSM